MSANPANGKSHMLTKPRQQRQQRLDAVNASDRITVPHTLRLFRKHLSYITNDCGKSLAWLVKHAGRTKGWWSMARAGSGRIVVRVNDIKTIALIDKILHDTANEEDRQLQARLEVMQAVAQLNDKINALVRVR